MSAGILVTGATGFVGRRLMPKLIATQRPLVVCVRDIRMCPTEWHRHTHIKLVRTGAIETAVNLPAALSGVSTVIHMAGLAHVNHPDRSEGETLFDKANALATQKLAVAAVAEGVETFIHLSSLFAVTDNHSSTVLDDHVEREPSTAYGRSKRSAEKKLLAAAGNAMCAISLRPPLIIGSDAKGNWSLLQRLAASGIPLPFGSVRNCRSMVSVDTMVNAVLHLSRGGWGKAKSGNYCIADRGFMSLRQMVSELRTGMNIPTRLFPFPPALIRTAGFLTGQSRKVSGMLGDLPVDPGRFADVFSFKDARCLEDMVRASGSEYARRLNG